MAKKLRFLYKTDTFLNQLKRIDCSVEYYEPLEHCLGSLEQVMSKGWSRTESAPIF